MPEPETVSLKARMDALYKRYNSLEWLVPDPLAVVLEYKHPLDMEIAGMVSAALALGYAPLIVRASGTVLATICRKGRADGGMSLHSALAGLDATALLDMLGSFKYRFFTGRDIAAFLFAVKTLQAEYGSLERAFMADPHLDDPDYAPAASRFIQKLREASPWAWKTSLFPDPMQGSAAKRTFLFLRWMIRHDNVDPGVWKSAESSKLLVPLDTHMASACRRFGFLTRKTTDLAAAREATASLAGFCPEDPVKYDFCLTRPGIHPDLRPDDVFA